jgi:hypothetical protein
VEIVAAALGDDVHVLADHAGAVGRFGAERLDLDVLDRVVVQVHGEDVAAVRIGHIRTVEAGAPLGSGQLLRRRIDRDAGTTSHASWKRRLVVTGTVVNAWLLMLTDKPARSGSTIGDSTVTFTVSVTAPTDTREVDALVSIVSGVQPNQAHLRMTV